ncbi:MAG: hypothetical protein E7043_08455 [Lentisphaerae bacterium]|nr:hypothetical protein [Lentisphaerota bacterium]
MSQEEKKSNVTTGTCKKKIGKIVLKVFLWTIGSIIALMLLLLIFINPIMRFAITRIGSAVTGVEITLDEFDLSLLQGEFTLGNLQVSNPSGFGDGKMLDLKHFHASWDNSSLLTENIMIRNIEVDKLHLSARVNRQGLLNFLVLLPPGNDAPPPEPVEPAKTAADIKVWIKNFSIHDFRFVWLDERQQNNIHGFSVTLGNLSGSLTDGSVSLQALHIDNPESYDLEKMLTIAGIDTVFDPDSIYTPSPAVDKLHINGLAVSPEFNWNGNFNVLDVVDSITALFASPADTSGEEEIEAAETGMDAESEETGDTKKSGGLVLKYLLVTDSRLTIYDDRLDIPVIIPLALEKSDRTFSIGETDILETMHNYAVKLRDVCLGVTNADEFILRTANHGMQALNNLAKTGLTGISNAAESGKKLLQDTTESGKKLLQDTTESGKKLLQNTTESLKTDPEFRKKTVKTLVELFK